MHCTITSDLRCCLSDKSFSLDELIHELTELFEKKGFSGFVELLLKFVQEKLILETVKDRKREWGCCSDPSYSLNGGYNRKLKTSLGVMSMRWQRLKCGNCKMTPVSLKTFLGIEKHQYNSNELEKLIIDCVSANSYRRAVETAGSIGFVSVPHTTAHRWVIETDSDTIDSKEKLDKEQKKNTKSSSQKNGIQLLPDGTKFKGQPQDGKAKKGDLKVVIGVDNSGDVFPVGAWTSENWDGVRNNLENQKLKLPDGSILLADGEPGLAEAFADMVDEEQRCQWHINRDLYHAMWADGGNMKEAKPIQSALAGVFQIELPEEDFNIVSEAEKDDIEERMESAESAIWKLICHFEGKGYKTAANYLTRAMRGMFGYVRRWLKLGVICPRASSMVERVMRELGRRLKKLAYNWSDHGAVKIARIVLKKFTDIKGWDDYWAKRMKLDGNVILGIANYRVTSQNLEH